MFVVEQTVDKKFMNSCVRSRSVIKATLGIDIYSSLVSLCVYL